MNKSTVWVLAFVFVCVLQLSDGAGAFRKRCRSSDDKNCAVWQRLSRNRRSAPGQCFFNNVPVPPGHNYTDPNNNCLKYNCVGGTSYKIIQEGCFKDGKCYDVDSSHKAGCGENHCYKVISGLHPTTKYVWSWKRLQCDSKDGQCIAPGSSTRYLKDYHGETLICQCDKNIRQNCFRPNSPCYHTATRKTYKHGQNFTTAKCQKYECSHGLFQRLIGDCQSGNKCVPHGKRFIYPDAKSGKNYDCNCLNGRPSHCFPTNMCLHKDTGKTYEHGQNFTTANCEKYECSHGQLELLEKGCLNGKKCEPQGKRFIHYDAKSGKKNDCNCLRGHITQCVVAPTKRGCSVDGVKTAHNETFRLKGRSKCFLYQCMDGAVNLVKEGCEIDGKCHPVDSEFTIGKCDTYVCKKTLEHGIAWYRTPVVDRKCEDKDGKCHEPGQVFSWVDKGVVKDNCTCRVESDQTFYKCSKRPEDVKAKSADDEDCEMHGNRFKNGEVFTHKEEYDCIKYKCNNGNVTVLSESCVVDGKCVPEGHTWEKGCLKFKCGRTKTKRGLEFFPEPAPFNCRDIYGNCLPQGSLFYHSIHRIAYPNCTCRMEDNTMRYTCIEAKCNVDGRAYSHGHRFHVDARGKCVTYFCWHGGWSIAYGGCEMNDRCYKADHDFTGPDCHRYQCKTVLKDGIEYFETVTKGGRCKDALGVCHNQGSRFFYKENGVMKDCTCHFENGKMNYICK